MPTKESVARVLADIRFWIIIFCLVRLAGITSPPLEMSHSWRQSMTCMVTRNFYEEGVNMFYPRVDMTGTKTGFIGSEFPFFNYLCFLLCKAFGYAHWYGRLINLIVSGFGIYYFYRLIKNLINPATAFCASIVLLSSIWFAFSRKIMPDTFALSLLIAGLYYGHTYTQRGALWRLLLFFVLSTLGILSKLPSLCLLGFAPLLLVAKETEPAKRARMGVALFLIVAIVYLWYFQWVPHLVNTYDCPLFFPRSLFEGFKEQLPLVGKLMYRFYFSALHSYMAFACCLAGIVLLLRNGSRYLQTGLLLITLTFFVFVLKTGYVFPAHSYYIIPYTPVMALLAGYAIAHIRSHYRIIILVLVACEGIAWQANDFFVKDTELYKLSLESIAQKHIGKNELVLVNGNISPQELYFAHRRGWSINTETMLIPAVVDSYMRVGASWLLVNKTFHHDSMQFKQVYTDAHYDLYRLK